MIFILLTFLAALSVAGVAEWFSIVGLVSIYAGAPHHAGLVLGVVLGFAKLVTVSWLYRNWSISNWRLKLPLLYFMLALMSATSMGVFGFLTKSHLEQGAATIDNSAKVERLDQRIAAEKSTIEDDQKVITQLDASINSYIGKDNADKAVSIRKMQAPQRKQLRSEIDAAQKRIDTISDEKLQLTSQVRALQLEVGPIRYIAELFYGTGGDETTKVESAVKMFTLLIVSTLDPLATILLIAANKTLLRRNEDKNRSIVTNINTSDKLPIKPEFVPDIINNIRKKINKSTVNLVNPEQPTDTTAYPVNNADIDNAPTIPVNSVIDNTDEQRLSATSQDTIPLVNIAPIQNDELPAKISIDSSISTETANTEIDNELASDMTITGMPGEIEEGIDEIPIAPTTSTEVFASVKNQVAKKPWAQQPVVLRELLGEHAHFTPLKINDETKRKDQENSAINSVNASTSHLNLVPAIQNDNAVVAKSNKYPERLSWLEEFKGN